MSGKPLQNRAPAAFNLDDPSLKIEAPEEQPLAAEPLALPPPRARSRRTAWGGIFWSALGGLVFLWLLLWIQQTVLSLLGPQRLARLGGDDPVCGRGLAFVMIVGREIAGLFGCRRLRRCASARRQHLAAEDVPRRRGGGGNPRDV